MAGDVKAQDEVIYTPLVHGYKIKARVDGTMTLLFILKLLLIKLSADCIKIKFLTQCNCARVSILSLPVGLVEPES